ARSFSEHRRGLRGDDRVWKRLRIELAFSHGPSSPLHCMGKRSDRTLARPGLSAGSLNERLALERDLVVEVGGEGFLRAALLARAAGVAAEVALATAAAAAVALAVEHRQLAAELLQHHLGHLPLGAR